MVTESRKNYEVLPEDLYLQLHERGANILPLCYPAVQTIFGIYMI